MNNEKLALSLKKPKRPLFSAFALIALSGWLAVYFHDFAGSPAGEILRQHGKNPGAVEQVALLALAAGVVFLCVFPYALQRPPAKLAVHVAAFLPFQLLPLLPAGAWPLALFGGFCLGIAAGWAMYTMFFHIAAFHPAKVAAAGFAFAWGCAQLCGLAPTARTPVFYYAAQGLILAVGLVLGCLFDGGASPPRKALPEKKMCLREHWPALALLGVVQLCFALCEALLPLSPIGRADGALRILPGAVTLLAFWLLGRRLTVKRALLGLAALLAGGLAVFLVTDGWGPGPRLFMEPARLFAGLLFLWLLYTVLRANQAKCLRVYIACAAALRFALPGIVRGLSQGAAFPPRQAALLLPAVVLIAMLVSPAERAAQAMEALHAYGERPPPDAREDVLETREKLLRAMPEASLSEAQRTCLACLIDGRDAGLMAHFLGLPPRRARQLSEETLALLGFASQAELLLRLGELRAGEKKSDFDAVYEAYGLTLREREVCTLLLTTGGAQKHIAGQLSLSADTVKFHIKNIYRKLGVQSRAELEAMFHASSNKR